MTSYQYIALNRKGDTLAGQIDAISSQDVLEQLHKLGHLPVEVIKASESQRALGAHADALLTRQPTRSQITLFTRELAMLLDAGLPLDQSLRLLESDTGNNRITKLIRQILNLIVDGKSLHEALVALPSAFPAAYTNMIRIAEATGTLPTVLERIATSREREQKLRAKALSAVIYPCILFLVAIGALVLMLAFVVPRFKQMIVHAGVEIPESAKFVMAASDWLIGNWAVLLVSVCGIFLVGFALWRQSYFRQVIELTLLKLPLVGNIMRLNLTVRFCRTLGTLLESGVELPVAMTLVRDIVGNKLAAEVLEEVYAALRKGQSFLDPLGKSQLFPAIVVSVLRVGEETGSLAPSSLHLAKMFEDKLETTILRTFALLEPAIILLVSIIVGGIIMSILGAVISINDLAV